MFSCRLVILYQLHGYMPSIRELLRTSVKTSARHIINIMMFCQILYWRILICQFSSKINYTLEFLVLADFNLAACFTCKNVMEELINILSTK